MRTNLRSKPRSAVIVLLASIAMIAALSVPATADSPGVAAFRGCANVGPGLNFPGVGDPQNAGWAFDANDTEADKPTPGCNPTPEFCKAVVPNRIISKLINASIDVVKSCKISVAGVLGAVGSPDPGKLGLIPPLGGWCGLSTGNDGVGTLKIYTGVDPVGGKHLNGGPPLVVDLNNVGWVASAGSVLPVNGRWSAAGEKGTIVALVQASGGDVASHCAGQGAPSLVEFDVNAVSALI